MKRLLHLVLLAAVTLAASACGGAASTPVAGGANPSGVHLLVAIQGNVSIKRAGWKDYAPALFGMILRSGDLLRLESAAKATVACTDLTVAQAAGGVNNVPCKTAKPVLSYGGSLIIPTRSDAPPGIPLIVSPRKTKVLVARPILRWTPVSGASVYKVSVNGPNVAWSAEVSGKTEVAYPDNAPALAAGASYKVTVTAGALSSDEERGPGLGFTMLKAEEAQAVRDGEARIRALGLPDNAARLLVANLYASQGLSAEAIERLEEMTKASQEPAVVRLLGDLYMKVGLNRLAEERYGLALSLSQKAGDIEGQAAAHNALGLVYETFGNKTEAIEQAQKAVEWYQKLGDSGAIKEIQERLTALQK